MNRTHIEITDFELGLLWIALQDKVQETLRSSRSDNAAIRQIAYKQSIDYSALLSRIDAEVTKRAGNSV